MIVLQTDSYDYCTLVAYGVPGSLYARTRMSTETTTTKTTPDMMSKELETLNSDWCIHLSD
jgi:hypothetical protein